VLNSILHQESSEGFTPNLISGNFPAAIKIQYQNHHESRLFPIKRQSCSSSFVLRYAISIIFSATKTLSKKMNVEHQTLNDYFFLDLVAKSDIIQYA